MGKGKPKMKFLVAYTGSAESKAALEQAISLARVLHATVIVITSMEGGRSEKPEEIARVNQELKRVEQQLQEAVIPHEVHEMARGLSPGEDIVIFAEENDIDQIFVGIEKKSKTRKLLLGSTAQYIILKANCPVTTVK
jgi:nucleotide-binding universal stress UspA family protein